MNVESAEEPSPHQESMKNVNYRLDSLTFSDGTTVQLSSDGVTVLVGPNNAGKSLALREILQRITGNPQGLSYRLVTKIEATKIGTNEELVGWVDSLSLDNVPQNARQAKAPGSQIRLVECVQEWTRATPEIGKLTPFFVYFLNSDNRTQLVSSTPAYDLMNDTPQTPLQFAYAEASIEKLLSDASMDAFGTQLFINRSAGTYIHLQLGEIDSPSSNPPNAEYIQLLRSCEHLHQQGDGMKSFLGIILGVITRTYPVVIIDEPEAYLHPPQAFLLGRKLGALCPRGTQVIIATHSSDVLRGLLEENSPNTQVIRLSRSGNLTKATLTPSNDIKLLWNDPFLKHSRMLDGLFHQGTVMCESESDVAFYSAVADNLESKEKSSAGEIQFAPCGGKERLPLAIRALRVSGAEVRAIADFDVLRSRELLKKIVVALGGKWENFEKNQITVARVLNERTLSTTIEATRYAINELLDGHEGIRLTQELALRLEKLVKIEAGWDEAKRAGVSALTGENFTTGQRLIDDLGKLGLFVVPVGELERFSPANATSHGARWTTKALLSGAHLERPAQEFIATVIMSFKH